MGRTHALLEKYFEGAASPEELAELGQFLHDPEVADLFARMSRLEASLRCYFLEKAHIDQTRSVLKQIEVKQGLVMRPLSHRYARRRWTAVAAALLLVAGVSWWLWSRSSRQPEMAEKHTPAPHFEGAALHTDTVQIVAGKVHVDGRAAKAARMGERLRVVSDMPALLAMDDGSQAEMEPESQVILHRDPPGARPIVQLLEGAGTFKVPPGEGQFQVETEVGRVIVLGTEFRVKLLTRSDESERVFSGTNITALAVIVNAGIVQVDLGGKSHFLTAGQDRLFRPEREAGKGIREMLAVFESQQQRTITVRYGGDRPKLVELPLAADARVTIDAKPATIAQLTKGTTVYLQRFTGDDEVIGVRATGPTVTGTLSSVDPAQRTLTLALRGGKETPAKERTFSWHDDAKILIHDEPRRPSDLLPGMQLVVRLSVDGGHAVEIVAVLRKEKDRRP